MKSPAQVWVVVVQGDPSDAVVYDSKRTALLGVVWGIDRLLKSDPKLIPSRTLKEYRALKKARKWQEAVRFFQSASGCTGIRILRREIVTPDETLSRTVAAG